MRRTALLLWLLAGLAQPSHGADVTIRKNVDRYAFLTIEGPIVHGDADKILALTKEAATESRVVSAIYLRSPGGDVLEALKISRVLNDTLITASAPISNCNAEDLSDPQDCVCYSSCAIVWLTAALRSGTMVGIHRPSFDPKYFAELNRSDAKKKYMEMTAMVSSFLVENEVPPEIISKMMSVPSGDIHLLTDDELALAEDGKPYIRELLHAKCIKYQA